MDASVLGCHRANATVRPRVIATGNSVSPLCYEYVVLFPDGHRDSFFLRDGPNAHAEALAWGKRLWAKRQHDRLPGPG